MRRFSFLAVAILCAAPYGAGGQPPVAPPKTAEQLFALYLTRDYFELETQLDGLTPGDQRRVFFEGQLDAAFLRGAGVEEKLRRFLALPDSPPAWRKAAWLTLGNIHLRQGDYENAAHELEHALGEPGATFAPAERLDVEQNLVIARVLRGSPPPSHSDRTGPFAVSASRGIGGMLFIDVSVNGMTQQMLVDTGANICVASETFARLHKIHVLPNRVEGISSTGKTFFAHVGLADTVQVGKMVFHHVVFLVGRDEDLATPGFGITTDGMVGLPLIIAMEHLRVAADGSSVEVGGAPQDAGGAMPGKNIACDGLSLLAAIQYQGHAVPFELDTGSNGTYLYRRFIHFFPQAVADAPRQANHQSGIGGQVVTDAQMPAQIALGVHGATVVLHDAIAQDIEPAPLAVCGLAGANLLIGGFDLDFRRMELSLVSPAN